MSGKSAAMMRCSSVTTLASSAATGRCSSRSAIGATCWLISLRLGQCLGSLADVSEPDIDREHAAVQLAGLDLLALLLQRPAEPVEDAQALLITRGRQLERAPQDRLCDHVGALFDKAHAHGLRAAQLALRRPQRLLQLRDGLVQQPHFLEGHPEIVVRLEIGLVDVLVDALLEARQHLLAVLLLVPGRLLVGALHARVALWQ